MKSSLYPPVSLPNLLLAIVLVVTSFVLLSATIHRSSYLSSVPSVEPPPERAWPMVWASYSNEPPEPKYFQEAGNTLEMSHYDIRFFQGVIPYSQHREVLQHLIRSYLSIMASLKMETWIAHGTLLGWWWNGRIMPWDYDLDVQVSLHTMEHMAKQFNQTLHEWRYTTDEGGEGVHEIKKTYLLDVNPNYSEMKRRQGMNVIDARWVDVDTGMFVDITALAERNPVLEPGIWSCKNFHQYRTHNIWPLKETRFEGVKAKVPLDHERILVAEYGEKSLVLTEWEGTPLE
ncbi:mannosyltransferase [Podospora pseudocomata]|uniref:Mannosyltransferase n=3 Tax=Podospora TaxID=5144 RepID=A0ABR0HHE0_9PEZI|nr:mannosyltransferase [Podospora pseudocomata]KAK4667286.1 mannosyltransferase [Podospora pseudopauciseta]KAK4678464.1 mannosyltransferase [Podospora pseudoanserina]